MNLIRNIGLFWAIFDQGLYSIANFFLSIIVLRILGIDQYGIFAIYMSINVLFYTIQSNSIFDTLLVFGSRSKSIANSLHILFRISLILVSLFVIVFLIFDFLYSTNNYDYSLIRSLSFVFYFTSLFVLNFIRKYYYVLNKIYISSFLSFLYLVNCAGTLIHLYFEHDTNMSVIFVTLSIITYMICIYSIYKIDLSMSNITYSNAEYRENKTKIFQYNKWTYLSGILLWVPSSVYYIITPIILDIETVAEFKIVMNLIMPIIQFNIAMSIYLLRTISNDASRRNHLGLVSYHGLVLVVMGLYYIVIKIYGSTLLSYIYGAEYDYLSEYLAYTVLIAFAIWLSASSRNILLAKKLSMHVFYVNIISSLICIVISIFLIQKYSLVGIFISMSVSYFVLSALYTISNRFQ